jgi:flagellar basal body-associated protein FliL
MMNRRDSGGIQMVNTIATIIFLAIAAIVLVAVAGTAIPWIQANTTAEQQEEILAWAKIAVSAAEQIFTGTGRGAEKKAYVLEWLTNHGITVDSEKLDAIIESAVYILKNEGATA